MPAFQFLGGDYGRGLLESALAQPQQQFAGRYLYRTIYDKAAALFRSIILNHPLLDGNKRTALASVTVFLLLNGAVFNAPRGEAVDFALRVAKGGSSVSWMEVSRWLRRNSNVLRNLEDMIAMAPDESVVALLTFPEAQRQQVRDTLDAIERHQSRLAEVLLQIAALTPSVVGDFFAVG
ncbi:MAG: type II toxin-antitoxin system death-on-curing family toxin [Chloroflexi bacterium]|nr:type II toxin-antitoxin system death-on-curing family toxin [Chloroflexota bacterium]